MFKHEFCKTRKQNKESLHINKTYFTFQKKCTFFLKKINEEKYAKPLDG